MTPSEVVGVIVAAVVGGSAAYSVGRWWRQRVSRRMAEEAGASGVSEPLQTKNRFDQEPEA